VIELTVNGDRREVATHDCVTLLDLLRARFDTFGVREGCGIGVCGACTVLIEGRAISSCLVLAGMADGWSIDTVEGLAPDGDLDPLQQAFVDHNAFQCSYCTPGFLLMTRALLAETPHPTADQVREYLAGNLCRCGSYTKILDAVLDAAARG
jgi:aerobic-type carbon monoxide dehydrogenase small subunit (CoxS/CutS family)